MNSKYTPVDDVISTLRKIMRAIDLHSHKVYQTAGLTIPQILILKEINNHDKPGVVQVAKAVNLSQATVTNILLRLEQRGLILRGRSEDDRRQVELQVTEKGQNTLEKAPPLLHDRFIAEFNRLADWEQTSMLSVLQRVSSMMDAGEIDAAPILVPGEIAEKS